MAPPTDFQQKGKKLAWNEACDTLFTQVKTVLRELSVLKAPDFTKSFALAVDTSQVGVGAVLMQPDGVNVCYFSKKSPRPPLPPRKRIIL